MEREEKAYPSWYCECNNCGRKWSQAEPKRPDQTCPKCGSEDIECRSTPVRKGYPHYHCKCNDCLNEWEQSEPKYKGQVCAVCGSKNIECKKDDV